LGFGFDDKAIAFGVYGLKLRVQDLGLRIQDLGVGI
jgi:hypothetical protein